MKRILKIGDVYQKIKNFLMRKMKTHKIIIKFWWPEFDAKIIFGNEVIYETFKNYVQNYMIDVVNKREFSDIEPLRRFLWQFITDKETYDEMNKEIDKLPVEEQMEKQQWKMLQL